MTAGKEHFIGHIEKLITGAMKQVRRAHGEVLPGSVARRVASQLWGEASADAHPNTSAWVRHVRSSLGLTQSELAARLGTNQVTVARWETGKVEPAPYYRRAIEALGRTLGRPRGDGVSRMTEVTT